MPNKLTYECRECESQIQVNDSLLGGSYHCNKCGMVTRHDRVTKAIQSRLIFVEEHDVCGDKDVEYEVK